MPGATSNSGIRDNHRRGLVADFLKAKIKEGSRLSVVSAYFTIYAYEALKGHLDRIEHLDFLFGEPRFISSLDAEQYQDRIALARKEGLPIFEQRFLRMELRLRRLIEQTALAPTPQEMQTRQDGAAR
jgi:hypothetical protein